MAYRVDTKPGRVLAWIAAAIVVAVVIVYVPLTLGNETDRARTVFVATYTLLMAALLVASSTAQLLGSSRMILRAGAAGGLLVLGVLALMSIGLPMVIASVLAFLAAANTAVEKPRNAMVTSAAAGVLAVVVLIAGFEVSQRMIFCPAHGYMGGGGTGFVTGPYHFQCVNGKLNWHLGQCTSGGASIDASGYVTATSGC